MFGKGGGALGAWIKEFCELVFIQTLQAFIYALCVGLIMQMNVAAMENSDAASVLGFMCVICLTAIFKVEDILRKILGFGSTKADHGSAIKSIAKTGLALKLGSRVLDNGKKVVGGAKNMLSANKDAKKALNRLEARKQAYYKDNNLKEGEDSSALPSSSGNSSPSQRNIDSQKRDEKLRLFAAAQRARKMAQTETDPDKKKALIAQAKQKLAQSKAIDDTLKDSASSGIGGSSSSGNGGSSSSGNGGLPKDYHQKMLALRDEYKDAIDAAKKKRKEGFRTMTKGVAETAGAVIGGTAGGILGFADGNLDEGLQGMVSGAGVGDAFGAGATNTVFGAKDLVEGAASITSNAVKDYATNISKQYEDEKKNAISQIKEMNKDAQSEVNRINKKAQKARDGLEKEIEMSAGQTAKAMAKAVGKGSARAYKSRHGGIKQLQTGLKDLEKHIETTSKDSKLPNSVESID